MASPIFRTLSVPLVVCAGLSLFESSTTNNLNLASPTVALSPVSAVLLQRLRGGRQKKKKKKQQHDSKNANDSNNQSATQNQSASQDHSGSQVHDASQTPTASQGEKLNSLPNRVSAEDFEVLIGTRRELLVREWDDLQDKYFAPQNLKKLQKEFEVFCDSLAGSDSVVDLTPEETERTPFGYDLVVQYQSQQIEIQEAMETSQSQTGLNGELSQAILDKRKKVQHVQLKRVFDYLNLFRRQEQEIEKRLDTAKQLFPAQDPDFKFLKYLKQEYLGAKEKSNVF